MKKILVLMACLLALPLMAQRNSYEWPERQIPADVYEALLELPALQTLQSQGQALSRTQEAQLASYKQTLKGLHIIEIGYYGCPPCGALLKALEEVDQSGLSLIDQWKKKGIAFYQLEYFSDIDKKDSLSKKWNVQSCPTLIFIKDGEIVSRLKGFDSKKATEKVRQIKQLAIQYSR